MPPEELIEYEIEAEKESMIDEKDYQRLCNLIKGTYEEKQINDKEYLLVEELLLMQLEGQITDFPNLVDRLKGKVSKSDIPSLISGLNDKRIVLRRHGVVQVDENGGERSGRMFYVPKSLGFDNISEEEHERKYIERNFPDKGFDD